jgi:ADP-ribose diphosphatase
LSQKPKIRNRKTVLQSRLFRVDAVDLEFASGQNRTFEMIVGDSPGGVVVIPRLSVHTILLLKEYALGTDAYELGFVKGLIEPGETPEQAANRELAEEAGYLGNKLVLLDTVTTMPAYSNFKSYIFLASDLQPASAIGDEPEPLQPVPWPIDQLDKLHDRPDLSDARTHLAIHLLSKYLQTQT